MGPIVDAKSPEAAVEMMEPINALASELAKIANISIGRRAVSKAGYREIHALLVNVPRYFEPEANHPLRSFLQQNFSNYALDYRVLLVGVRLKSRINTDRTVWRNTMESFIDSIRYGVIPLSEFDEDYALVSSIMRVAGFTEATETDFKVANAWWSPTSNPEVPMLVHPDHLHVFRSVEAARGVKKFLDKDCATWPEGGETGYKLSFGTLQSFDLPTAAASDSRLRWASSLIQEQAVAISIRSLIEPVSVTRKELQMRKSHFISDVEDRVKANRMERAEQIELVERIGEAEEAYALGGGYPLLAETTITAAFAGDFTSSDFASYGLTVLPMYNRQEKALADTMLCSNVRANPYKLELPSSFLAASGISSLSIVGDKAGALVGFTELDRQTAFISPTDASEQDALPIVLVVGQTGSGKSMLMLWLAAQFSQINQRGYNNQLVKTPVVVIDPKPYSDHSYVTQAYGGTVYSLDDLLTADGPLDPLRFSQNPAENINIALSNLLTINPWGSSISDIETPLAHALHYGVQQGARCIGDALTRALQDGEASKTLVEPVIRLAESLPMFRACVGINSQSLPISISEGITLIKVGNSSITLPSPGVPFSEIRQPEKIGLVLVRMMVFGSANAVSGRGGVVMLDEAWVFLGAGRNEMDRLGRLARSQNVLPILFTQKVSDALDAKLEGYISRGIILPISDQEEAKAACRLFKLEPTTERIDRITAPDRIGGNTALLAGSPNTNSMRALRDPDTGDVIRGTIGIYCDLAGRAVPVEIALPPDFLKAASTRPSEIRERRDLGA